MSDLSPLSEAKRKSDFGAVRSVDVPEADFRLIDAPGVRLATWF